MKTILLISPYWKEPHRWMVSSVKLAELWQRLGYRVVVACMGQTKEAKDAKDAEDAKENVSPTLTIYRKKDFFLPDPWNYGIALGFTGMVRRIIRDEKPDVIVTNKILFWTSLSLIPLTLSGHRIILLTDALVGMTWWGRTFLFRLASRLYAWTLGWVIMLCSHKIIFFHPQPARLLKMLGVWKKSQVIPTGIDPVPYRHLPNANLKPVITYVGRLESVKGVDDFLAATTSLNLGTILPDHAKIQVVGWYKNHPLVAEYKDRVTFTGLRDDIPAILSTTDIFVLPSHSEGLSNALMEAMASGCACVASDVGGNAFLIQNGMSGFLFPVGDRAALAAHLRRLIEDPAKRKMMGEAARKRIEEQFSWDVIGKMYRKLFEEEIPSSISSADFLPAAHV